MTRSFTHAVWIGSTMAVVLACYTISLTVSSQRAEVERLRVGVAADKREIVQLQSELRTLARMPELQRWSDQVFDLHAPTAPQFVHDVLQLASYAPGVIKTAPPVSTPSSEVAPGGKAGAGPAPDVAASAQAELPPPNVRPVLVPGVRQIAYIVPKAPRFVATTEPVQPDTVSVSITALVAAAPVYHGVGYVKVPLFKAQR